MYWPSSIFYTGNMMKVYVQHTGIRKYDISNKYNTGICYC